MALMRVAILAQPQRGAGEDLDAGSFVHLQHPKTGAKACYLIVNDTIQEVHWFKTRYVSWLIGEYVCEDGSLYLGSVVDPVFMVLPVLERSRIQNDNDKEMFRSLDEMLYIDGYPGYSHLLSFLPSLLNAVCDTREVAGSTYFKLNDAKVLGWLCCKVKQTCEALKMQGDGAFKAVDEHELKSYAVGLLSEYLNTEPWLRRLCEHLAVDLDSSKRSKTCVASSTDFCALPRPSPVEVKQSNKKSKRKNQAVKGNSKITGFFASNR